MSRNLQTKTIVGADGEPMVINASDFDAEVHQIYGEAPPETVESQTSTTDTTLGNASQAAPIGDGSTTGQTSGDAAASSKPLDPPINNPGASDEPVTSSQASITPIPLDAVDVSDLDALTWPQLRSAAAEVSETPVSTKEDAVEAIRLHRAQNPEQAS